MLYLKDVQREKKDTLYTFLKKCISPIENVVFKAKGSFPSTYENKDCSYLECGPKYRSLESIIDISKTYFKVSDKHVSKVLKKLCFEDRILGLLFCLSANKWIFYTSKNTFNNDEVYEESIILNYNNSVGKKDKRGTGKYTYNEIRELMDN